MLRVLHDSASFVKAGEAIWIHYNEIEKLLTANTGLKMKAYTCHVMCMCTIIIQVEN